MKIRTRFFLFFLLLVGLGFYQFVSFILEDLRPRYLATMEESMAETATLFSSLISSQLTSDHLETGDLEAMIERAKHWNLKARIYEMEKERFDLRVYVTDSEGMVLYDSKEDGEEGADYSQWNDVYLTLRGSYGARATRDDPEDPASVVLYVAAPIMKAKEILGVVTVAKPAASVEPFHKTAKEGIVRYGVIVAVLVIGLGIAITFWITSPIEKLTGYANEIRDGNRPTPPTFGKSEMGKLAGSFEEMRDALEGKKYVEHYIETLTHEMKSPLSAIRGAAELIEEDMPAEQRKRFLGNILSETTRIQTLVDRLLELSSLESKKEIQQEEVDLSGLLKTLLDSVRPQIEIKQLNVQTDFIGSAIVKGESFLLEEAMRNLVQNAIDFTPEDHLITLTLEESGKDILFRVHNTGSAIPDFAVDRLFDRFYSLARPDTGRKSSGIGLPLVKEIAELHGGTVTIRNEDQGVTARLTIPKN